MKKFEYKSKNDCDSVDLNKLGEDGWELCSVISFGIYFRFYFKREIISKIAKKTS